MEGNPTVMPHSEAAPPGASAPTPTQAPPVFAVVVPCFNEEGAILETVKQLQAALAEAPAFELIVVNDGSTDRSGEILDEAARTISGLRVVHHPKNQGYGAALKSGIRRTSAELIVITDADGTYPNDRIPELVAMGQHADMIIGARVADGVKYSMLRSIPKAFLRTWVSWLVGQRVPDMNSGLRVFRRRVAEKFLSILPDGFSFTTTITLAMMTHRYDVRFEPITYSPRVGKSKIKPVRDTLRFSQLILRTGMYFAPLRLFFPLGMLFIVAFVISFIWDAVQWNLTDKTIMFMLAGLNTMMFALLADMIHKRGPA